MRSCAAWQRLVLVDAGCGRRDGTGLGRVEENLAVLGGGAWHDRHGAADALHSDHVGGLVDGAGKARLPYAELIVHADELSFCRTTPSGAGSEENRGVIRLARSVLEAYRGRVREVVAGEVAAGRYCGAGRRAYAGAYRVADCLGWGVVADLGRL